MIYPFIKKALFSLEPETAHELSIQALKQWGRLPWVCDIPSNPVSVMGLQFKNPVGLAAGADKNGEAIEGFARLGFGFIEVGTVTPLPQGGNPRPRQFRLIEAEALINRNGFNNLGVDVLLENIQKSRYGGILGINIGKNAATPIERSIDDYLICLRKVYLASSYVTVNISSPNTQNLRSLQYGELLDELLHSLKREQQILSQKFGLYRPLVLKVAPDLNDPEIVAVANALLCHQIDGVVAGNTSLSRDGVVGLTEAKQVGGLSGKPLNVLSNRLISMLARELKGRVPIIGCGGIHSVASGQEKINLGADLLQLYSALVYQGPGLIRSLAQNIRQRV